MLEFFEGDSMVFIFSMDQTNGLQVQQVQKPSAYRERVLELHRAATQPLAATKRTQKSPPDFAGNAYLLYQFLLEETFKNLLENINHLIIVPDGLLGYVPFELLISEPPSANVRFDQLRYLLHDYNISYAYSAKLLLNQIGAEKGKAKALFAGFAPQYQMTEIATPDTLSNTPLAMLVRDGNYALPGAKAEVEQIAELLQGKAFFGQEANEYNFKKYAPDFRILHLAMHSFLEDQNPLFSKLLFTKNLADTLEDNELKAIELHNLQLNAELAVLSACNTGFGKLSRGEGVMSLSRAFSYAGVPATVMSLWKVPDQPTKDIMLAFYKNLKVGQTKDMALRNAKLEWLNATKAPELAHPYYWAGFVAAGDMAAMDLSANSFWWWMAGAFGVLILGFFLFRLFGTVKK